MVHQLLDECAGIFRVVFCQYSKADCVLDEARCNEPPEIAP